MRSALRYEVGCYISRWQLRSFRASHQCCHRPVVSAASAFDLNLSLLATAKEMIE